MSEQKVYARKAVQGGMAMGESERLRQLLQENQRLREIIADLSLDTGMLKVLKKVIEKNGWTP